VKNNKLFIGFVGLLSRDSLLQAKCWYDIYEMYHDIISRRHYIYNNDTREIRSDVHAGNTAVIAGKPR